MSDLIEFKDPKDAMQALDEFEGFRPSSAQMLAKDRVYQWLARHKGLRGVDSLTRDELVQHSGNRKILEWAKDRDFIRWFYEADAFAQEIRVGAQEAFAVVRSIALDETGASAPRERLKAAETMLNLAGAFPSRTKEVRFIDRDLDSMPEHEVDRQLADAKRKLSLTES